MERLKRCSILLSLIRNLREQGSWCGETHIQKTTYFLQELLNIPLGFDFILYKYGPYSFDLTDELSAMRADKIVALQPKIPYGPSYIIDEVGHLVSKLYPTTLKKFNPQITFVADKLGNKNVSELERLATALYICSEIEPSTDIEKQAELINKIKPHISLTQAKDAIGLIDQFKKEAQELIH